MMAPELVLLLLRWLGGLLLLLFVGLVFYFIRCDMALTAVQVSARRRRHGQLLVVLADEVLLPVGTKFPLLPISSLGRSPANTVHLPDDYASTHHALLSLRNGRWWLEDLGSRNGTTLNGQPLQVPTVVGAGDVIGIGRVELKVELE